MRISVVLPAPLGPRMAKMMPRGTSRSIPATACTSPKLRASPRAEIASCAAPVVGSTPVRGRTVIHSSSPNSRLATSVAQLRNQLNGSDPPEHG